MASDEEILENVRQLMDMGLQGHALLEELMAIGFSRREAREWIDRAFRVDDTASSSEKSVVEEKQPEKVEKEKPKTGKVPEVESKREEKKFDSDTMELLFRKGILATVDSKLERMEKIRKEIDNVIESKVSAQYSVLEKKIETLFSAQRELMLLKMESQLSANVKNIDDTLDSKIEDIRKLNLSSSTDLQKAKAEKMAVSDLMNQVSDKIEGLDLIRRQLLEDTQSKLEELQQKVDGLIFRTEERLEEAENKATQTLQLEEKITSGLAEQVENQANAILEKKVSDLRDELKEETIKIKQLNADLSSEGLKDSVSEIRRSIADFEKLRSDFLDRLEDSRKEMENVIKNLQDGMSDELKKSKKELSDVVSEKGNSLEKAVDAKVLSLFDSREGEFVQKMNKRISGLSSGKKGLQEKMVEIDSVMQNLELFKGQFLDSLKQSKLEREDVARVFSQKLIDFDTKTNNKLTLVDSKMHQVDSIMKEISRVVSELNASQTRNSPLSFPDNPIKKDGFKGKK